MINSSIYQRNFIGGRNSFEDGKVYCPVGRACCAKNGRITRREEKGRYSSIPIVTFVCLPIVSKSHKVPHLRFLKNICLDSSWYLFSEKYGHTNTCVVAVIAL